jgi:hypothetical protein
VAASIKCIREQIDPFREGVYLSECSFPIVDIDFLLKEVVDAIYITITNIGREAPRMFDEVPRLLLAS